MPDEMKKNIIMRILLLYLDT